MKISIALQTDKTAAEYIALAQLINPYDFDVVSVYCDAPFHPSYGPLLLMAPHITRARLGPAAVPPTRIHPIDIAAQTALLADVAQGGVYIGLARGAWLADHGITDSSIQTIREAAAVIRYLLAGGSDGYEGQIFRLAPHVRPPYPTPLEPIPLLIGSWGRKLCALAGEIADEVKVGGSANPAIVPVIRSYIAEGSARSVGIVLGAVTVVDEDRDLARAAARRSVALYLPVVAPLDPTVQVEPELVSRLQKLVEANDLESAVRLISDELLQCFAFAGNPADVIEHALSLHAKGVARVEFGTPHGLRSAHGIKLIGEKVIPALRSAI
ncbi:MAG: LLM class flavin-dependent oxidoreductase [Anaerolineae bacterium]|nr:LLM class flavin-dependent oxidoreductase [Anaerolineae bacterium]